MVYNVIRYKVIVYNIILYIVIVYNVIRYIVVVYNVIRFVSIVYKNIYAWYITLFVMVATYFEFANVSDRM